MRTKKSKLLDGLTSNKRYVSYFTNPIIVSSKYSSSARAKGQAPSVPAGARIQPFPQMPNNRPAPQKRRKLQVQSNAAKMATDAAIAAAMAAGVGHPPGVVHAVAEPPAPVQDDFGFEEGEEIEVSWVSSWLPAFFPFIHGSNHL